MRGIPWVYAPTTMMAMLDSCIGGKSSINVTGIKNLVGNIYPPSRAIVDVTLAQSLPVEARVAGYSEAVKICFAGGPAALDRFMELVIPAEMYGNELSSRATVELTHHVLNVKKWFIEIDELDRRERLLLNFGHTFGHALESALDFSIPHGVAIAIGMNAALKFSDHHSGQAYLLQSYITTLGAQLPATFRTRLQDPDWERFSSALASDKKGTSTHLRFVLESRTGALEIVERERSQATFDKAREVTSEALDEFAHVCVGGL
jgi:3-dehydroquinate synthase